uniref:Uncharacterized protein n=1 Tax=Anopheles funestus TaxID=62324 RepID=A0A182S1H7_ANOFN
MSLIHNHLLKVYVLSRRIHATFCFVAIDDDDDDDDCDDHRSYIRKRGTPLWKTASRTTTS